MRKRIKRACTVLLIGLFGFTLSGCMEADEIKDAIESALSDDSTAITVNGVESMNMPYMPLKSLWHVLMMATRMVLKLCSAVHLKMMKILMNM